MGNFTQQQSGKRLLKIYRKFFQRSVKYLEFLEIWLTGKWVEQTGFRIGDNIQISHEHDRILITKAKLKKIEL